MSYLDANIWEACDTPAGGWMLTTEGAPGADHHPNGGLRCSVCGNVSTRLVGNPFSIRAVAAIQHAQDCAAGLAWAALFAENAPALLGAR